MLNGLLSKLLSRYPSLTFLYKPPANKKVVEGITLKTVCTPASAITLLGLILSLIGAFTLNTPYGFVLVVLGRILDLLDGPISRLTTPTRFGAMFDATADKIAIAVILVSTFIYGLAPALALAYIVIHNLLNAVAASVAQLRGNEPEADLNGKLSMFFENIALFAFIFATYAVLPTETVSALAWALLILSVPFGLLATEAYIRAALGQRHK